VVGQVSNQVQDIIKLEPSVDRLFVHFVMLDFLPMEIPPRIERRARD